MGIVNVLGIQQHRPLKAGDLGILTCDYRFGWYLADQRAAALAVYSLWRGTAPLPPQLLSFKQLVNHAHRGM